VSLHARLDRLERARPPAGCPACRARIEILTVYAGEPVPPLEAPCRCRPPRIARIVACAPHPRPPGRPA
jgi:hypothetical protein